MSQPTPWEVSAVRRGVSGHAVWHWSAVMVLAACLLGGCAPASTSPIPTATPSPPTSIPTATPVTGPVVGEWSLSGDVVSAGAGVDCASPIPESGFILGADPTTCAPAANGGAAAAALTVPLADGPYVVVVQVECPGSAGCAGAVRSGEPGGEVAIAVDGLELWHAGCDGTGACDEMALGQTPVATFVTEAPAEHTISLSASANVAWSVAGLQVAWYPLPAAVQGIAYSPFRDCQNPNWGPYPTQAEIRADLALVRHMSNAIRTYSSTGIQGQIPALAREAGLRVSAGAWLGHDPERNEEEIAAVIELANTTELESIIVGNEVLLRGDLSEDELIAYIERVKAAVDVPVTTAEIGGILLNYPRVMDAVDYNLVHIYAFWDGVPIENAARYTLDVYRQIEAQGKGKRVVIGEVGWPSAGPPLGGAVPSPENQRRFMREFLTLAQQESIEFYYFDAFDELWKTAERGVGQHWGYMTANRHNKYELASVLVPLHDEPEPLADLAPVATGTPGPAAVEGQTFPVFTNYAAEDNHFAPGGWMGDLDAIRFSDCYCLSGAWTDRVIEIQYSPSPTDEEGWAGIYWLEPDQNWGTDPFGYDLTGYAQLHFQARSAVEGTQAKFIVGGVAAGEYPSSITAPIFPEEADSQGFVTLSTAWQTYHFDLRYADLSHVIDGFGWVSEQARTPDGATIYLDEIAFDREPPPLSVEAVYVGPLFGPRYTMGVDSSGHLYDWVTNLDGAMRMSYPAGQSWGAVFVTVVSPVPGDYRPTLDLSMYDALLVDLRGERGGEVVAIGIKDGGDPDDGSETKLRVTLTDEWQTYEFPLSSFATADLAQVYVPVEFVFEGGNSQTVYFRNVKYVSEP